MQSRKGDVRMKNYIFDLYGTLIDIHTNESKPSLWRNMASLLSLMGASYNPGTLKKRYRELVRSQRAERLPVMREKFGDDGLPEEDVEICLEESLNSFFWNVVWRRMRRRSPRRGSSSGVCPCSISGCMRESRGFWRDLGRPERGSIFCQTHRGCLRSRR